MIPWFILAIENEADRVFMTGLFLSYQKLMYSEIIKIVKNEWDAEDVLQNTLIKLIDKLPELREKEQTKLINYIITACKNNSLNYIRDRKRTTILNFDDYINLADDDLDGSNFELKLIAEEEVCILVQIWPQLDQRSKYLLEGKYILEKKDEELAEELKIKPGSVRMALSRARKNAFYLMHQELIGTAEW